MLDDGRAKRCELRLPYAAILEAKKPLVEVAAQLSRTFAQIRDDIERAVQNGYADFAELAGALRSDVVDAYAQRRTLAIIDTLATDPAVQSFVHVPAFFAVMEELRPICKLEGKDKVDLYVLASVLHDRREHPDAPAVFFSANRKEFDPGAKVPDDVYATARLTWRHDFDLSSALGAWHARFRA